MITNSHNRLARRPAYTLVEVLVCLGIFGILSSLLIPAVQSARDAAGRTACGDRLRQIGLALHHFHDAHHRFPPLPVSAGSRDPNSILSWRIPVTPFLGHETIWRSAVSACAADPDPWHTPPHTGLATVIEAFVCPSDRRLLRPQITADGQPVAFASYVGVAGGTSADGVFGRLRGCRLADVTDGASCTLLVGERPPAAIPRIGACYADGSMWDSVLQVSPNIAVPNEPCQQPFYFGPGSLTNRCDQFHFWSLHVGGCPFVLADGSVRFFPYHWKDKLIPLATRAAGDTASMPN